MAKSKDRPVQMGNIVRDRITGFTGTIIQKIEMLTGADQYAVQPERDKKDGKLPEAFNFDIGFLEFVSEGVESTVIPAPIVPIKLGDEVKDKVTGLVGITTFKSTFLNGCVYFQIQPVMTEKDKGEPSKGIFTSFERFEVIKTNAFQPTLPIAGGTKEVSPPLAVTGKCLGGPTTRAFRAT